MFISLQSGAEQLTLGLTCRGPGALGALVTRAPLSPATRSNRNNPDFHGTEIPVLHVQCLLTVIKLFAVSHCCFPLVLFFPPSFKFLSRLTFLSAICNLQLLSEEGQTRFCLPSWLFVCCSPSWLDYSFTRNKASLQHFSDNNKEMATHSSILAWKIPWMEEPWGRKESDTTERLHFTSLQQNAYFINKAHLFKRNLECLNPLH